MNLPSFLISVLLSLNGLGRAFVVGTEDFVGDTFGFVGSEGLLKLGGMTLSFFGAEYFNYFYIFSGEVFSEVC
jgi:hypothetical protein